jgi:hypothetical protein
MKRGLNKRAQEGTSAPALGAIVLVIIVVVLLVLVLSGFMNPILEKMGLLPGSGIAGVVTACEAYVPLASTADYCSFKEVKDNGRTQYVNCMDSRIQGLMKADTKGVLSCNNDNDLLVKTECADLIKQTKANPLVNQKECLQEWNFNCGQGSDGLALNGQLPTASGCGAGYRIISGYNKLNLNEKCCVVSV